MLTLLPAVDVADGKAVRLLQGEVGSETDYGSPVDAARDWVPTLQVARDGAPVEGAWAAGDCAAVPDLTSEDPEATCAPTS